MLTLSLNSSTYPRPPPHHLPFDCGCLHVPTFSVSCTHFCGTEYLQVGLNLNLIPYSLLICVGLYIVWGDNLYLKSAVSVPAPAVAVPGL